MIVVLCVSISEREFRAYHACSLSWLSIRILVCSLVGSWSLGSLRGWSVISWPTLVIRFILWSISCKVPSRVHHGLEIHVIVNTSRNIGVVFNEFIKSNSEIPIVLIHYIVMSFECLKELFKDLFFRLSSFKYSWVLLSTVNSN